MIPQPNITFTPRLAAILFGWSIIIILLGYSVYAALPYLNGPSLDVVAESDENGLTLIQGKTARVSYLSVNESPVALNEDGSFSIERAYPWGYTTILIVAKDRFGREITKNASIVTTSHAKE